MYSPSALFAAYGAFSAYKSYQELHSLDFSVKFEKVRRYQEIANFAIFTVSLFFLQSYAARRSKAFEDFRKLPCFVGFPIFIGNVFLAPQIDRLVWAKRQKQFQQKIESMEDFQNLKEDLRVSEENFTQAFERYRQRLQPSATEKSFKKQFQRLSTFMFMTTEDGKLKDDAAARELYKERFRKYRRNQQLTQEIRDEKFELEYFAIRARAAKYLLDDKQRVSFEKPLDLYFDIAIKTSYIFLKTAALYFHFSDERAKLFSSKAELALQVLAIGAELYSLQNTYRQKWYTNESEVYFSPLEVTKAQAGARFAGLESCLVKQSYRSFEAASRQNEEACSICQETEEKQTTFCKNGHQFHEACISYYFQKEIKKIFNRATLESIFSYERDLLKKEADRVDYKFRLHKESLPTCPLCRELPISLSYAAVDVVVNKAHYPPQFRKDFQGLFAHKNFVSIETQV